MSFRPQRKSGVALPALLLCLVVCLSGPGCIRNSIQSARRQSTAAYEQHLRAIPAAEETPEQSARTAALRQRVLRDEWLERGYRVGNEKGGGTGLYSAAGRGLLSTLWYPFRFVGEAWSYTFGGDRPNRAARLMEDGASADARRRGINDLVRWDFALDGPYVKRYRQIATGDPDPLVRATAIRALNRARDAQARPIFINALRDASVDVRIEAAKALDNLPDPNAADPLVRTVANPDEDRDVRIAAASALRHYKSLEVARALIPRLNEHDFAIAWQSRRTLRQITGKDMRYNEAAWLAFVSGPDKPLG
jgi:hypothetical protein